MLDRVDNVLTRTFIFDKTLKLYVPAPAVGIINKAIETIHNYRPAELQTAITMTRLDNVATNSNTFAGALARQCCKVVTFWCS